MSSAVVLVAGGGKYHRSEQMSERTADDTEREQQTRHGKPAAEEATGSFLKKCPTIRTDRSATWPAIAWIS